MGWVGAHGRVPLVATLLRRDDDPMPTTGRTSRWSGTGIVVCLVTETSPDDLGVSGSMGRCPPDHDPVAGTRHHPKGVISRRPRPGRISPPKGVVSLTQGDGRLPQAGQHASDSKQGKNQLATDCGFRCPWPDCRLLPSTGICCSAAARTPGTPASSPPSARYRRTAPDPRGRAQRPADVGGQVFARLGVSRRRTTLSDPTATSATAPPERTWTASSATSRTGSHTHTASSLSNAAHASHHRQHTYH
jgi:hypothetical protein